MDHIKAARWTYYTGNLWGIFKNRHLSNATGRLRDESLMNLGGRVFNNCHSVMRMTLMIGLHLFFRDV
jgi:hypothetical protein